MTPPVVYLCQSERCRPRGGAPVIFQPVPPGESAFEPGPGRRPYCYVCGGHEPGVPYTRAPIVTGLLPFAAVQTFVTDQNPSAH